MTIEIGNATFCTNAGSPEVILLFSVPFVATILLNGDSTVGYVSLSYGVLLGVLIYLIVSIVKNVVANFMDSDAACRIPPIVVCE